MTIHSWFNVTTWADRDWQKAKDAFDDTLYQARCYVPSHPTYVSAGRELDRQRAEYRHRILSWYWKLLVPTKLGDAIPNEVAALLAEEWDLATAEEK